MYYIKTIDIDEYEQNKQRPGGFLESLPHNQTRLGTKLTLRRICFESGV